MANYSATYVVTQGNANATAITSDRSDPFTGVIQEDTLTLSSGATTGTEIERLLALEDRTKIEQAACYPQLDMYNLLVNAFCRIVVSDAPPMTSMVIQNTQMPIWNFPVRISSAAARRCKIEVVDYNSASFSTNTTLGDCVIDLFSVVPDPYDRSEHEFKVDLRAIGALPMKTWNNASPALRIRVKRVPVQLSPDGIDPLDATCSYTSESLGRDDDTCSQTSDMSGMVLTVLTAPPPPSMMLSNCSLTSSSGAPLPEPKAMHGYFPLYDFEEDAAHASPVGTAKTFTFDSTKHYMPEGLLLRVQAWEGDYDGQEVVVHAPTALGDTCSMTSSDEHLHDQLNINLPYDTYFVVVVVGAGPLSMPVRGDDTLKYFSTIMNGYASFVDSVHAVAVDMRQELQRAAEAPPEQPVETPFVVYGTLLPDNRIGFIYPLYTSEACMRKGREEQVYTVFEHHILEFPDQIFYAMTNTPTVNTAYPQNDLYRLYMPPSG